MVFWLKTRARYGTGDEISITILIFILENFKQKSMIQKNLFGALFHKFGQKEFYWKKRALSVFKYSNYLPSRKKTEKTNEPLLRKMPN